MFNEKIWEWAREIVARGDVTELTTRVYRQIVAEAELNRISKAQSNTGLQADAACTCAHKKDGSVMVYSKTCPDLSHAAKA